jgi:ABC-type bacteriocin/lantibiotic exporter with double-glycine peptidase domain
VYTDARPAARGIRSGGQGELACPHAKGRAVIRHRIPVRTAKKETTPYVPPPVPWRRVAGLLGPIRWGLAGMVVLSVGGVLVGLVPPLALGALVDALIERNDRREAALLAGLIALTIIAEATAYVLSDGMYARNAGRLHRNLRLQMFDGVRRRLSADADLSGIPTRFISDAQTLDSITVSILGPKDHGRALQEGHPRGVGTE